MKKQIIDTNEAPKAASFFSQAVLTNHPYLLELSGQIGLNPETMKLVDGGVKAETEQIFKNIQAILKSVGWSLDNITKVRVYLTNMNDYQAMNEVYAQKFIKKAPARVAIAVKELPLGAKVEIECNASGNI